MWRSRMFWRLFLTFGTLPIAAVILLDLAIVGRVEQHFLEQVEDNLRGKAVLAYAAVEQRTAAAPRQLEARIRDLRRETATRITLLADDGRVLADSEDDALRMDNHNDRPELQTARAGRFGTTTRYSATVHEPMMYVALRTGDVNGVAFVRVAVPLGKIQAQLAGLRRIGRTTALMVGAAAVGLAFFLARRISLPLQELTAGAERVAAGEFGHKVYAAGRDEAGVLGAAFNHMSERLAQQFAQLAEDRQQLRAVLRGMVEGVIAIDAEQRVLFANDRAGQLLEFSAQGAVGRRLWEVVRHRPIQEAARHALSRAEPHSAELNFLSPAARNLMLHVAQMAGSPTPGAVLVLHDITDLRRLERMRQEFSANVSHELKTPLAIIKAATETLLDGAVDDREHRSAFLEQIADQAERLHALILDLLSLARIESGAEVFELEAVPLDEAVAACVARHQRQAAAKKQVLAAVPPAPGAAVVAWADAEAVGQILDNLVTNAVKYTPAGGRISVHWAAAGDQVRLDVADTGIGIPEADLPRVFERFYRVDKARSRELGGTGLGLSIVKHLVQAMHGTIGATSQPGAGSVFTVSLPRAP